MLLKISATIVLVLSMALHVLAAQIFAVAHERGPALSIGAVALSLILPLVLIWL